MKKFIVTKYNTYIDVWQYNGLLQDHKNIHSFQGGMSVTLWENPFISWYDGNICYILGEFDTYEEVLANYPEFWM